MALREKMRGDLLHMLNNWLHVSEPGLRPCVCDVRNCRSLCVFVERASAAVRRTCVVSECVGLKKERRLQPRSSDLL